MDRKRPRLQYFCTGSSRAKPSFKDECDVNRVMARFEQTGIVEHTNAHQGNYGDFLSAPSSYHEAVQQVADAQQMFMSLPAKVRARFSNDPGYFLEFVEDPDNLDEMVRLGLATKRHNPSEPAGSDPSPKGGSDPGGDGAPPEPTGDP